MAPPRLTARERAVATVVGSGTRLAAVLGHPVRHSVSPQIHSAAFAALGLDVVYLAFDVAPADLSAAVAGLRALDAVGVNCTVPHKEAVVALLDERSDEVARIGAANTLWWQDGRLHGDNTDAAGLAPVLRDDCGLRPGDPVVLFGAGGAARAAAVALGRAGAAVEVVARRAEAAEAVATLVTANGGSLAAPGTRPRLVVNATPLGLAGEPLPDRFMRLDPDQVALDLLYGPRDTPFLAAARERGAHAVDGLGMLVGQAAESFERWTGLPAPRDVMMAAARRALGRSDDLR